jgi:hypothetical protein
MVQPERKLSDTELDRPARELFAEVRAQNPGEPRGRAAGDTAGDVGVDPLDWLLGNSDGDDAEDSSGD